MEEVSQCTPEDTHTPGAAGTKACCYTPSLGVRSIEDISSPLTTALYMSIGIVKGCSHTLC